MKAGSLHTACGLPQVAHRICPERVVFKYSKINSSRGSEKLCTCAHHGTIQWN